MNLYHISIVGILRDALYLMSILVYSSEKQKKHTRK